MSDDLDPKTFVSEVYRDAVRDLEIENARLRDELAAAETENARLREGMTRASAELRHAYAQLANGLVTQQRRFADGLIAPQIERLEALVRHSADA